MYIKKLNELMNDPDVEIWAMDEVMFQQHGSVCKMWVAPEERDPVIHHHPTRKSVGYYGAVRLRDGNSFIKESQKYSTRRHASVF